MLSHVTVGILPSLVLLAMAATALCIHFWYRLFCQASFSIGLPWAGAGENSNYFSRIKACLTSIGNTRENLIEGYSRYSKQGRVYVLPNLFTGPEVIVPMSQMKWLMEQPDNVLNQGEVNIKFLQADHTMLHRNIIRDTVHQAVIRRELTAKLENANPDIVDELNAVFEEHWGTDTNEWREVEVYETMLHVIARISTRVFVGLPLCRNEEYLNASKHFAQKVILPASFINMMPQFLRPVLGPFVTWFDTRRYKTIAKLTIPTIRSRQAKSLQAVEEKQPNDYIQWALRHATMHWDRNESTADMITRRLAVLSFGAIQSSVITITNVLFDLAASPNLSSTMSALNAEVKTELAKEHSHWNKKALLKMIRLDSALRESMRLGGFISRGVMKMVMPAEGITLPDGTHVPKGFNVGVTQYSIHHDEDIYPNAQAYDAFRFSKSSYAEGEKRPVMVTTSPIFMAFSHGPHSCPGRFFAANQLKLTLAHIVLNYEIRPMATRPTNLWFAGSIAPPMKETMFIRRRKAAIPTTS